MEDWPATTVTIGGEYAGLTLSHEMERPRRRREFKEQSNVDEVVRYL